MTGEGHFVALFQRPIARAIQSPQLFACIDGKGRIVAGVEHVPLVITDDNERLGLIRFELLTQHVKRRIDAVDVALDHLGGLQLCRVWLGFLGVLWNTAIDKRPAFLGFKHGWRVDDASPSPNIDTSFAVFPLYERVPSHRENHYSASNTSATLNAKPWSSAELAC